MAIFDIPVIVKAFAGDPNIIMNTRDNIIQAYAIKAGLTHFCKNSLFNMDFMKFNNGIIKQKHENPPRIFFYGISQGGIFGSAYSTLMGPNKLLDGAIIASAGTPFSLIMSRSALFPNYHKLMLLNLVQNRHVRIFISMLQMYYDSIEAGGILSSTKIEDRVPTLLQSSIGDNVVTSISGELLARNYDASIFQNNPKPVFDLSIKITDADLDTSITRIQQPMSVFTEFFYEDEAKSLPGTNLNNGAFNTVHFCSRNDPDALRQVTEFINTGNFVNVCPEQGCIRQSSWDRWNDNYCA